jgi:hypothetical protein
MTVLVVRLGDVERHMTKRLLQGDGRGPLQNGLK